MLVAVNVLVLRSYRPVASTCNTLLVVVLIASETPPIMSLNTEDMLRLVVEVVVAVVLAVAGTPHAYRGEKVWVTGKAVGTTRGLEGSVSRSIDSGPIRMTAE